MKTNALTTGVYAACLICVCLFILSISLDSYVSYAAMAQTTILLGSETESDHHIDLFRTEYSDASGDVNVRSRDNDNIIAPGTSGEHMILVKNDTEYSLEYEIVMDASIKDGPAPDVKLPIYVRMVAGSPSPKQWSSLRDAASQKLRGTLGSGQNVSFYCQWRWDEGDDGLDTRLSKDAGNMKLCADITVNAWQKAESEADKGSSTGANLVAGSVAAGYHVTQADELGWVNDPQSGEWYYTTEKQADVSDMQSILTKSVLYTGWLYESRDKSWYYLSPETGKMCTGWNKINGSWYYFALREDADDHDWNTELTENGIIKWNYHGHGVHSYGSMYVMEYTPDGYFTDSEGRWIQGG